MVVSPNLRDYDVNVLIAIGNQCDDIFKRNHIKMLIVEKLMEFDKPIFFFINKFLNTNKFLNEVYAEIITIKMKTETYYIDDSIINEILELVSLDTLMCYGAESCSLNFSNRCKEEFWNRGILIEDKVELTRKKKFRCD